MWLWMNRSGVPSLFSGLIKVDVVESWTSDFDFGSEMNNELQQGKNSESNFNWGHYLVGYGLA
jgi:hypothetical protein